MFDEPFDPAATLHAMFRRVDVVRAPSTTLFTFGDSELEYFLVVDAETPGEPVSVVRGEVKVTRPTIIRPDDRPELSGFFGDDAFEGDGFGDLPDSIAFMMARTAAFQQLKIDNRSGRRELRSDSVGEVVERIEEKLDAEGEDRVGVLTAPHGLGPIAVLKFAAEQIARSAPGNIRELQEKGFLPGP